MKLFPTDLPELKWVEFSAEGFSKPVSGVIHRVAQPAVCGMPLGGIDTGCLDLASLPAHAKDEDYPYPGACKVYS